MSGRKTYSWSSVWRRLPMFMVATVLLAGFFSCRRNIDKRELLSNYEENNFSELFQSFWQGMNTNYLYWDKDTVNWDGVYKTYKPKFDSLDAVRYSDTSMNKCFQYMADMTKDLKDGQYALQLWNGGDFRFEDSLYKGYISFIPKLFRAQRTRSALPDTLFDYIVQYNYLKDFDYGLYRNYYTNSIFQIITGRLKKGQKNIIYTSLNLFAIKEAYNAPNPARPPRPVIKNFFDNIHKSNCDGVIIDLRNNRGGNLEDVDFLVGQFTSTPMLFGYARYKSGVGRLDYTPPLPLNITPQANATDFNKPIVILADIYSAALSETVIQAFKALPGAKVILVGEHTYGTSGLFTGNDISTNGGSFNLGQFGSVRLSNTALEDRDHNFNFSGISPDFEVKYNAGSIDQMLRTGVDIQLEKAIQVINQ
jgi:carboxyl-terminal processing protease